MTRLNLSETMRQIFADEIGQLLLADPDNYRIEMITRVRKVTPPPRWAFWRSDTIEWVDISESIPAHVQQDGQKLRFIPDKSGGGWDWHGDAKFKEFVLWHGDTEIMRGGALTAIPLDGSRITPNFYLDLWETFQ